MNSEYLEQIRQTYILYTKFGLKFATPNSEALLLSKNPVNIELKPKIIETLQNTIICKIPTGLLYMLRYYRYHINKSNIIQYYYFDEETLKCLPIKNSEQYLLTLMNEKPDLYKSFDEFYDFSIKEGSDIITCGIYINKVVLTKSQLFKKVAKYIIQQKIPEFQIFDSEIISKYASYWMYFKRECLVFADDEGHKPDYRITASDLSKAFHEFCVETHNDYDLGIKRLKKELKQYYTTLRMFEFTPEGRKYAVPSRGYRGFKLKEK